MRYALSTSWNYRNFCDAKSITDEIKSLGFDKIELNFALTKKQVEEFAKLQGTGYIRITSTHNFCPLPEGVEPECASPEYYSLSSLDEDERRLALKFTKKSIDYAHRMDAYSIILHIGRVEMEDRTKSFFEITDTRLFHKELKSAIEERDNLSRPYLSQALKSLEELLDYASKKNIILGIENRYYIKELPSLNEFKIIFDRLKNRFLGYWHDTGHAQLYENLHLLKHEDYLDSLKANLIGFHLHDIMQQDDHMAPGCGEFDFSRLKPYINENYLLVIEAHRKATAEDVRNSISYLNRTLGRKL